MRKFTTVSEIKTYLQAEEASESIKLVFKGGEQRDAVFQVATLLSTPHCLPAISIDLYETPVSDEAMLKLAGALSQRYFPKRIQLSFIKSQLSFLAIKTLIRALAENLAQVTALSLTLWQRIDNFSGDAEMTSSQLITTELANLLSSASCPPELDLTLAYCRFNEKIFQVLLSSLTSPNALQKLSLSLKLCFIGNAGAKRLARSLSSPHFPANTTLDLTQTSIGVAGVIAIISALKSPSCQLKNLTLNLSHNLQTMQATEFEHIRVAQIIIDGITAGQFPEGLKIVGISDNVDAFFQYRHTLSALEATTSLPNELNRIVADYIKPVSDDPIDADAFNTIWASFFSQRSRNNDCVKSANQQGIFNTFK